MGGTKPKPGKPRPSYELGKLRDETIVDRQEATYTRPDLAATVKKAAQPLQ